MSFFPPAKRWSTMDLGVFKIGCILFGMIAGAHTAAFVRQYLWVFAAAMVVLLGRAVYFYWIKREG